MPRVDRNRSSRSRPQPSSTHEAGLVYGRRRAAPARHTSPTEQVVWHLFFASVVFYWNHTHRESDNSITLVWQLICMISAASIKEGRILSRGMPHPHPQSHTPHPPHTHTQHTQQNLKPIIPFVIPFVCTPSAPSLRFICTRLRCSVSAAYRGGRGGGGWEELYIG